MRLEYSPTEGRNRSTQPLATGCWRGTPTNAWMAVPSRASLRPTALRHNRRRLPPRSRWSPSLHWSAKPPVGSPVGRASPSTCD